MKKLLYLPLVLLLSPLLSFNTSKVTLPIGSSLPKAELKLADISGRQVSMRDATKKNGLLVMFSCNTCPYVIRNQQRTKEACEYSLKNNIGVILLNSNEANRQDDDSFDAMKAYAGEQGYNWFYAVDRNNEVADAFGASRTPECFLFDKNVKLVYHGAIDDNPQNAGGVQRKHLKESMDEMLSGKEVTVKESRSVGCGIKRI